MKTTLENARIWAIRERETGLYATEGEDGSIVFGPVSPETMFFFCDDDGDDDRLYDVMSACPGGHDSVEQVEGFMSVTLP